MPRRYRSVRALSRLALILALSAGGSAYAADDGAPSTAELLREMKAMEKRIHSLEQQLAKRNAAPVPAAAAAPAPAPITVVQAPPVPAAPVLAQAAPSPAPAAAPAGNKDLFGLAPSPIEGLKIGMYGELKYGSQQNPAAGGHWQTGFDTARVVLLPTYKFTDNIVFNGEIEFEHAGSGFDNDDKLHGTAEVEQAYVDFMVSPYFNIRSPGIDLVPIGYTNLHHEPTLFYSVNRPELDNGLNNGLVPTTWASPAASVWGKITDGLDYQFQVSSALEDFGDNFDQRTSANTAPSGPYMPGLDGVNGLDFATPPRGSFAQLSNSLGYALRLAYEPGFVPGLAGSTSVYYTDNIEPRGAHADNGTPLGQSSLTLVDSELRYRMPQSGLELRGQYAQAFFGSPRNLRANNDGDPTDNVGSTMYGLSGEIAYHVPLGKALGGDWQAVPFYRYSYMSRQTGGFAGTDLNAPAGAGSEQFHTVGVAVFPTPELVLKLNYQHVLDDEPGGPKADQVLGAVGWFF